MATQATLSGETAKATRRSYTREFKLGVVAQYRASTLYATSKVYCLNTKTILRWAHPKGSKHAKHNSKGTFSDLEAALYEEYQALWRKGLKVKGYWFRVRARQLLSAMHPEATFCILGLLVQGFQGSTWHLPEKTDQHLSTTSS